MGHDPSRERDSATERYFHDHAPRYSLQRYDVVADFISAHSPTDPSILDLGCGSGNVLAYLNERVAFTSMVGVDVSPRYLKACEEELPGVRTVLGTVFDDDLEARVGGRFSFVLAGALLHHLVGRSRRASFAMARRALHHAWGLVEPGGHLILVEPTFRTRGAMAVLFHVKRVMSAVTGRRVPLLGHWNNIGAPVVSYVSHRWLLREMSVLPSSALELDHRQSRVVPRAWRLVGITERSDSVVIARKVS